MLLSGADLRSAVRSLTRAPAFFALSCGTIALGVGLTSGVFSVVNAVLLRPLPYEDPGRLMVVGKIWGSLVEPNGASEPEILDWRERSRTFAGLEFTERVNMLVDAAGVPEWFVGARASRGLIDLLGVRPLLGRTFGPEEDQAGRHFVALISERLWRSRFAADTDVIGRRVRLSPNGTDATDTYEIIGVLPQDVPIDYRTPFDIVVPFVFSDIPRASGARRTASLQVIGRLGPGAAQEQASEEMRAVATVLNREYPMGIRGASVAVRPLHAHTLEAVAGSRSSCSRPSSSCWRLRL